MPNIPEGTPPSAPFPNLAKSQALEISPKEGPHKSRRKSLLLGFAIVLLIVGGIWQWYWLTVLQYREKTDDAYVAGNIVPIYTQVSGNVAEIGADDTDRVTAGRVLAHLDETDARIAYDTALASLADTVRKIRSSMAELKEYAAGVDIRRIEVKRLSDNLARREVLGQKNAVGREELINAREALQTAKQSLREAEEKYNAQNALLLDTPLKDQPQISLAAEKVRESWIGLQRTVVRSPVDGYVAKRSVQIGSEVAPGKPLMAVIPLEGVWIDANFKEGQLRQMRVGQPAVVTTDLYGNRVEYKGKVAGLGAGTGSAFSLLPPQNATGNWIKIVQRVPVRIEIDPAQLKEHPLLVGLSAIVTVDIKNQSGPMLVATDRTGSVFSTDALRLDLDKAEAAIQSVIEKHAPDIRR